jgi:hypothetical protein
MNAPFAFCPSCRKQTVFVEADGFSKCTACGAQFELTEARPAGTASSRSGVMSVFEVLFRVALILGAIVVVGLGVLFAGCALVFGGFH